MNVAFFLIEFPAFAQTYILNQITGLIDRGCEVDIYADRPGKLYGPIPAVEKYELLQKTRFFKTHFFQNLTRELSVGIMPFLRQCPYDILHCQFGPMGLSAMILRQAGGIQGKLITSFRGFDVGRTLGTFGRKIYDPLFDKGDLFLPVSENIKQKLIELGCPAEKIVVHLSGIDCERYKFVPRDFPSNGQIRLTSIARLVEKKGLEYGIQAAAKLSKKYNIEYNIVGDGPLKSKLEQLIIEFNAEKIVHLLGWKDQQEIIELLKDTHIFLAPSVTSQDGDHEGIPNSLKEAMATGLPVISTFHSGIPELVENDICGFLVPERDVSALEEKLSYLIDHPEIWPQMGQAGRKRIKDQYNIQKLNDHLIRIYQKLIE